MLVTTLALGLLLQSPQDMGMKDWVDRGYDPARPNAFTVSGTPELSRKDALAVVERLAFLDHRSKIEALARDQAEAASAAWLPGFVRDRVVARWTDELAARVEPQVVDRDVIVRDHGFGRSYQAFLLLDPLDTTRLQERGGLSRRLRSAGDDFLVRLGCMVGLWSLIGLVVTWLDRLTRGYMTRRLYAIGTLLALVGPALLVVFG